MTKQELAHIARLMYDLQEYCAFNFWEIEKPCKECAAYKKGVCDLFIPCHGVPNMWGITKADIERLERELGKNGDIFLVINVDRKKRQYFPS